MTKLLVSVRSVVEAKAAMAGGADLIDVKEPTRGALGAADVQTVLDIADYVRNRLFVSAAVGELVDLIENEGSAREFQQRFCTARNPPQFVKIGLAKCANMKGWVHLWQRFAYAFSSVVRPVAVIYADWRRCDAPAPLAILQQARQAMCKAVLIDTYYKDGGGLFDAWNETTLAEIASQVRSAGLPLLVAGQLSADTIPAALKVSPEFIAVRGAACLGSRETEVDSEQVRRIKLVISNHCAIESGTELLA